MPTIAPMVSQAPEPSFPSVQELSLTISADIEIHKLWKTITEILSQRFYATRITLCLPQDPTVVASSIENNLHHSRPWGLKAHWDYKHHFLDENTVTPKDEFAHHHHRLQKNASSSLSQEDSDLHPQNLRLSVSSLALPSSSSSSFSSSSSSSSSFSRRRAGGHSNNSFSMNLNSNINTNATQHHNDYMDSGSGSNRTASSISPDSSSGSNRHGATEGTKDRRKYVPIPNAKLEYHEDYWSTHPPMDGGYSSSTSSVSSFTSTGSSGIQASRAAAASAGSGGGHYRVFSLHSSGTECFANLQSLEYDPEPLLNENTVDSILKAGKTVVLTREYVGSKNSKKRKSARLRSFLSQRVKHEQHQDGDDDDDDSLYTDTDPADDQADLVGDVQVTDGTESRRRMARAVRVGAAGTSFELHAGSDMDSSSSSRYDSEGSYFPPVESTQYLEHGNSARLVGAHSKAGYADFVQGLNPTWSQSPAPSPNIIKEDPTINPFFFQPLTSYPAMDDDTFDPPDPTPDSTEDGNSSASEQSIYADDSIRRRTQNSASMSHALPLPPPSTLANARSLIHVPLYRSTDHNNQRFLPSDIRNHRPPAMPVGIISFLSDQIPYSPEALDLLTDLNPFLANQVTNALRLEDMMARSSRWGDLSTSGLSDGSRSNHETFSESIQRKMKDNGSDLRTPRPTTVSHDQNQDYLNAHSGEASSSRYRRYSSGASREKAGTRAAEQQAFVAHPTLRRPDLHKDTMGTDDSFAHLRYHEAEMSGFSENPLSSPEELSRSTKAHASESSKSQAAPSDAQSAGGVQLDTDGRPLSGKQPETCYNLDSTTDEIHRNLNLLNLDVTGSATCPLAPQTKKMLGRQHHHPRNSQFYQIENAFMSSWTGERRRTESPAPNLLDTEDADGPDGMWQTMQTEKSGEVRVHHLSSSYVGNSDFEAHGNESPYFNPVSASPVTASKRHLFSTSKRSGLRRRRKSVKDQTRNQLAAPQTSESPAPSSPYTPTLSAFSSHRSEASSGSNGFNAPAFSPDPSPMASPMVQPYGMFGHGFTSTGPGMVRDENRCLTWLNQRSLQYAGLPLTQLLHTSWTRLLHEDDRETFQPLFKSYFDRGEMFNAQYRVRRFDGQYRWFLGRILPVRDCGGNIVHWFGTSTDIHDQKLAELQLNRQVELELNEKKYRLLAEAIPQIVFTAAPQIGLTFANAKWFTYSGQVFEQACGLGFMDHV
ncbi:hypothetical protein EDD11_007310 [Mortierella claussenii]|nr:hypothetical protein EDD11_007310 [Mortierella claussenii]